MSDASGSSSVGNKRKGKGRDDEGSDDDTWDSDDDEDTIARIQRAHFAQAAAMRGRRRSAPRPRPMSNKRKLEAVKQFHDFTKKLKKDTGVTIRSLVGNNILELSDFSSEDSKSDSDGLSEEEFVVNPTAVEELNQEDESYIDPETGDFVQSKKSVQKPPKVASPPPVLEAEPEPDPEPLEELPEEKKTLSISDIISDGDLDLTKNVEISEVEESELCPEKTAEELLDLKEENSQDFDITEKLKEMGEISVKPIKKEDEEDKPSEEEKKTEAEDDKKQNSNAINMRRNIRDVMDEKNLDASTLAAQRQESERLARVQEQQRIIREVQRQIAINRQNKIHQKTLSLLQGGSSLLKKGPGQKLNLPNTVLVKLPSGEMKKTTMKQGQVEVTKIPKATTSGAQKSPKLDQKTDKKEVVEIVDSSSGEESSSSTSDSDDCIMLSDSEVPPSPEAEEDPGNSGLHVNDAYNTPDEQGRVLINLGHTENEEDIFLAPQIARIIKPHQIGGVRFLFDNIIESVERFSTSTGFGCILAHSMGLGKTLQIVSFCDIFLRHTTSKTVLCIMPINTLQNWVAEFNMWLPLDASTSPLAAHGEVRPRNFPIYVLNDSHKTLQMRAKVVKDWTTSGGVLMIGYELYRLLSMKKDKKPRKKKKAELKAEAEKEREEKEKNKEKPDNVNDDTQGSDTTFHSKISDDSKLEDGDTGCKLDAEIREELKKEEKKEDTPNDEDKKLLDEMYEALVRPGPDLVICDEGHRIKNSHSNISYALKQMRTKRRVVLTGYPLQNNLLEYWCMVDFVRPNYLGSKTEFCNMFERPIQNGQCIDSTPQDIRLMRYRAHVLHSLLVGFVQRRSHAVLQSTLPQKEEYVLLVRMTPLQRKLYDRFMNEVVRSTSVPNPLKAFAICCKIWNHPDVLYNFLRKRSEANAAIEEDLDLEELGGVTKAGRAKNSKNPPRRAGKPRGAAKKPAATIPPNTTTGPMPPRSDQPYGNAPYPPNGPYGPSQPYRPDQAGGPYPPYNYQNQGPGYYPPNQGYNQNYPANYYPQQQPYDANYPNQYPQNNPDINNQGYNQNYWGNGNYYGNSGYYNNPQYPNGPPQDYRGNAPPDFNNPQQYPPNYNPSSTEAQPYPGNALQPYTNNQEQPGTSQGNQPRPPYPGSYPNAPGFPEYNPNVPQGSSYPNNQPPPGSTYPNNQPTPSSYPNNQPPPGSAYPNNQPPPASYANNQPQPPPGYPNQPYPPPYTGTETPYGNNPPPYNQYENRPNFPGYPNNMPPKEEPAVKTESTTPGFPPNDVKPNVAPGSNGPTVQNQYQNYSPYFGYANNPGNPSQEQVKSESNLGFPPEVKNEPGPNAAPANYGNPGYNYNQANVPGFPNQADNNTNGSYPFPAYPALETKPPLGSNSSGSPLTSWPLDSIKTEVDKLKAEEKIETKSESDGEVKIADLDTKMIVKDEGKKPKEISSLAKDNTKKPQDKKEKSKKNLNRSEASDSEEESGKKSKQKGKGKESKKADKPKPRGRPRLAKNRKDRKTSKEKDDSESEDSEKEEKLNREEELALVKKAEEVTYDWAAELLKDYIPGIIENSSKMELFFYLLNESIKMGDRILLFSQSLFTLNLIEDFLERNYIPGTNCLWERNTNYYRLDGSTHALEREKLINEFNANPHIYLFLVSTRAGSLGINLVGANRVIVFDASWNPCHDTQAVCRVYRYGQKKPCFVYRFVMDWCLEKKIYDRQINKQGMADRVVDECNPDAVLSMKEITNLCFDNDEKESEPKDLSEHKDKYLDVLMQGIISYHSKLLSKEPFQHESLLVDRKEKKLSSAEKRLAQRGYELEKKAALAPKPTTAYRTVRTADGSVVQRPVASVRPMQHGARWIPADVWRRQGMTAQEMTLPLDVVIPTNSAEKTNIVLKAGQRVMVLKSPKGIYMQLESGKIIAIKTSFKGLGGAQKAADNKDNSPIGKKILGSRPGTIPGSLKNNSAITITSKSGPRPGYQRVITRPSIIGHNKIARPLLPGQKIADIRNRLEMRSYGAMRHRLAPHPGRILRPNLPGSLSITKIRKETKRSDNENSDSNPPPTRASDDDTQILDSDEEEETIKKDKPTNERKSKEPEHSEDSKSSTSSDRQKKSTNSEEKSAPIVLTTDEKLPPEETLESKSSESNEAHFNEERMSRIDAPMMDNVERKINLLKNYRHQRPGGRPQTESSLSILERTASVLNKEGMPDFRRNLDDITQSYSPSSEEKPTSKSKKKKSPNKESSESQPDRPFNSAMSHSVSSLLGSPGVSKREHNTAPVAPIGGMALPGMSHEPMGPKMPMNMSGGSMMAPMEGKPPAQPYPAGAPPPEAPYAQYPGYGMGYGSYPNPYYGYSNYAGYGGYGGAAPAPSPSPAPAFPPAPPDYLPSAPNPQW